MRDRLGPAVREYVDALIAQFRDQTIPELRRQGEGLASAAAERLEQRRKMVLKALRDARSQRLSPEDTAKLKASIDEMRQALTASPG
jgi:hypothetical protein